MFVISMGGGYVGVLGLGCEGRGLRDVATHTKPTVANQFTLV